jgi:hypothetical protein
MASRRSSLAFGSLRTVTPCLPHESGDTRGADRLRIFEGAVATYRMAAVAASGDAVTATILAMPGEHEQVPALLTRVFSVG